MLTDRVEAPLREAIATVRAFADQAEQAIEREEGFVSGGRDPDDVIGQVQSKLAWGMANASTSIRDALSMAVLERRLNDA